MKTQQKVKGDVFWNFCVLLNINYSETVLVYVCFFLIKKNGNETKLYFQTDFWTTHIVDKGGKILEGT